MVFTGIERFGFANIDGMSGRRRLRSTKDCGKIGWATAAWGYYGAFEFSNRQPPLLVASAGVYDTELKN